MEGFVLLSAQGAPFLQSGRLRLAQIDTKQFSHDDTFDEMVVQMKRLRGGLRWYFSPWVFANCIFSKVKAFKKIFLYTCRLTQYSSTGCVPMRYIEDPKNYPLLNIQF
jgi:hypothetical protein